jgi:membrane dipeptidase
MRLILAVSLALCAATPSARAEEPLLARTRALQARAIVIDTHSDTTSRMLDDASTWAHWSPGFDISRRNPDGHMDLPRMREGGLKAQFFAIYVAKEYAQGGAARRALDMIDVVYRMLDRYPDQVELARTASEIRRIAGDKKIAALMGIEGGHAIEDSLGALRMFYRVGVRYMTLTHTNTNDFCDSSGDAPRWHGLNELGRQVVREMNRIGMMVDVSHISDEAFYAVVKTSTAPVIASHSSCRALCSHPRNMTDDMIRALAQNGGVIQINFNSGFLDEAYLQATEAATKRLKAAAQTKYQDDPKALAAELKRIDDTPREIPHPALSKLIDHIDHAVKLVGADHVGLGSDFDGVPSLPQGLEDCSKLPSITFELMKRGYSDEDLLKILGGNTLRVMEAVEAESRRLQSLPPS